MRILHVVNVRWFNATAWFGITLADLLQQAGHDVKVLVLPDAPPHHEAQARGLDCVPLNINTLRPALFVPAWREAAGLLPSFRPHIVDCHRGEGFILWALLKQLGGSFKLVRTRGDQRPPKNSLPNRLLHRHCADAVIACNGTIHAAFQDSLGVPQSKLHLHRGGVDTKRFRFDAEGRMRLRREFGFAEDDFVLGLLGRYDHVKGHHVLAEAAARARRRGAKNLKLLFIGFDTALKQSDIAEAVEAAGMTAASVYTGKREDVPACISSCDLGVVPSLGSEAIARAALEIMACGVPLLASHVGVLPELLDSEALFPPGDADALAELLLKFQRDEAFRLSLTAQQAETIRDLSLERFLERSLTIYEGLLPNG
jgi:glycosyltransferase involved in cell wall biosynthesis